MKYRDLKNKTVEEWKKLLLELSEKRRELAFKIANNQLKNVRELRLVKKNIAQLRTLLNQDLGVHDKVEVKEELSK